MLRRWYLIVFSLTKRRSARSRLEVMPSPAAPALRARARSARRGSAVAMPARLAGRSSPSSLRATAGVEAGSPRVTPSSSATKPVGFQILEQVALGAGLDRLEQVGVVLRGGEHDDRTSGSSALMQAGGGQPVQHRHREVHQHDVGLVLAAPARPLPARCAPRRRPSTPWASSRLRRPSRKRAWSSAMQHPHRPLPPDSDRSCGTRTVIRVPVPRGRNQWLKVPPIASARSRIVASPKRGHALPRRRRRLEPGAIVRDRSRRQRSPVVSMLTVGVPRAGVLADIRQGFLDDAQELHLGVGGEARRLVGAAVTSSTATPL